MACCKRSGRLNAELEKLVVHIARSLVRLLLLDLIQKFARIYTKQLKLCIDHRKFLSLLYNTSKRTKDTFGRTLSAAMHEWRAKGPLREVSRTAPREVRR